jgi:hypothetical protein
VAEQARENIAALVEVLCGQQALLITMSHQSLDATKTLTQATAAARVAYLLPNWYGHDANNHKLIEDFLMTGLYDNVKLFEQLGVSSCFLLVCNFWYEFPLTNGIVVMGSTSRSAHSRGITTATWPSTQAPVHYLDRASQSF